MSHGSPDASPGTAGATPSSGRDFPLGLPGFRFSDLHDARRLGDLAREFDRFLARADPALCGRFDSYRQASGALGPVDESNLLIAVARHLSRFVGLLFDIGGGPNRGAGEG